MAFFLCLEKSCNISCKAGLVVLDFFRFSFVCEVLKLFIKCEWKSYRTEYSVVFFLLSCYKYCAAHFWPVSWCWEVSWKPYGSFPVVTCCFFFAASNVLSNLCHFTSSVSWCDPLGESCLGLSVLLGPWSAYSLRFGKFSTLLLTCSPLLCSSPFQGLYNVNISYLVSQMSLKLPFLIFFCSASETFTTAFQLTDLFLCFNLVMSSTVLISLYSSPLWWVFNIFLTI